MPALNAIYVHISQGIYKKQLDEMHRNTLKNILKLTDRYTSAYKTFFKDPKCLLMYSLCTKEHQRKEKKVEIVLEGY